MSKPYVTCPFCGDHLDHGEICECRIAATRKVADKDKDTDKKATVNPHKLVLAHTA